jgi:NAD(P)-dependent dehydrogenase (short-subunit alcohol dehydrogenase family)
MRRGLHDDDERLPRAMSLEAANLFCLNDDHVVAAVAPAPAASPGRRSLRRRRFGNSSHVDQTTTIEGGIMRELAGKTAFVTGGASGIGLALGRAFAEAGMNVMLADIEADALAAGVASLRGFGPDVRGVACDVADAGSVERAAEASYQAFGYVHVVCNNAGVAAAGGIDDISLDNWRWVLDVNLMGVLHGIKTFLPHIRAHGEGGHIVNTASMAGLVSGLGFSPYAASKFAVVNMSEALAVRLAPLGIGVSVLCPGFVRTRISDSGRNRPQRYGPAPVPDPASPGGALAAQIAELIRSGLDPADVAARVLAAIREDELYVFTHPQMRAELEARFAAILAAMDKAAAR